MLTLILSLLLGRRSWGRALQPSRKRKALLQFSLRRSGASAGRRWPSPKQRRSAESPLHHSSRQRRSADFQICCIAGFQTRDGPSARPADLEIGRHSRFGNRRYRAPAARHHRW